MKRRKLVAANWKMNKNLDETAMFVKDLKARLIPEKPEAEVLICPPFTSLSAASKSVEGTFITTGAQNVYWEESGAYTGEISPGMVKSAGCEYVIVGHSERRHIFGETDEMIQKKLAAVLGHGLKPILCVGETREEREKGMTEKVVRRQLETGLEGRKVGTLTGLVIAYEPVWAIGTGLTASPEQAVDVHVFIRGFLAKRFGADLANETRIQYGGSVKPENASSLLTREDIDGALVGGASLDAESFSEIVLACG
jgi:triosephosphate isomerase